MSGCPYNKYDFKSLSEKCKMTGEQTNGALICDFDYEQCEHYKEAHKPLNAVSETQYYQPDLFGGMAKL